MNIILETDNWALTSCWAASDYS